MNWTLSYKSSKDKIKDLMEMRESLDKTYPNKRIMHIDDPETDLSDRRYYRGLKRWRDKRLGMLDIGNLYEDPDENTLERDRFNRVNTYLTTKLRDKAREDDYHYKASLGIAPRYNPIGYIGRGVGSIVNKIKGNKIESPDPKKDLESPEFTNRVQDLRNEAYLNAVDKRSKLFGKKKGQLMRDEARGDVERSMRFYSYFPVKVKKFSL